MRVLLADDHVLFRDGMRSLLAAKGIEVVGEASDGRQAVEAALRLRPDVVLMDITMPEINGLEATRLIKARAPQIRIVMLTVSDDDRTVFEAIKSGAQGYLLKNLQATEFFEMLEGLERGEAPIPRALAFRILEEFGRQHASIPIVAQDDLTDRERDVLQAVSGGATNREIATKLHISENTVKFHMKNILDKLHLRSRAEVIAYAARRGLLPDEKPTD